MPARDNTNRASGTGRSFPDGRGVGRAFFFGFFLQERRCLSIKRITGLQEKSVNEASETSAKYWRRRQRDMVLVETWPVGMGLSVTNGNFCTGTVVSPLSLPLSFFSQGINRRAREPGMSISAAQRPGPRQRAAIQVAKMGSMWLLVHLTSRFLHAQNWLSVQPVTPFFRRWRPSCHGPDSPSNDS